MLQMAASYTWMGSVDLFLLFLGRLLKLYGTVSFSSLLAFSNLFI